MLKLALTYVLITVTLFLSFILPMNFKFESAYYISILGLLILALVWAYGITMLLDRFFNIGNSKYTASLKLLKKEKLYDILPTQTGPSGHYVYNFTFVDASHQEHHFKGSPRDYAFLLENIWYEITILNKVICDLKYIGETL